MADRAAAGAGPAGERGGGHRDRAERTRPVTREFTFPPQRGNEHSRACDEFVTALARRHGAARRFPHRGARRAAARHPAPLLAGARDPRHPPGRHPLLRCGVRHALPRRPTAAGARGGGRGGGARAAGRRRGRADGRWPRAPARPRASTTCATSARSTARPTTWPSCAGRSPSICRRSVPAGIGRTGAARSTCAARCATPRARARSRCSPAVAVRSARGRCCC